MMNHTLMGLYRNVAYEEGTLFVCDEIEICLPKYSTHFTVSFIVQAILYFVPFLL